MYVRGRPLCLVALAVILAVPLFGASGVAWAKTKAPACRKTHTCKSGSAGPSAPITVQVDPNPLVETGTSQVLAVIQVETSPSFAGDQVTISAPQLNAACQAPPGLPGEPPAFFADLQGLGTPFKPGIGLGSINATLDNEGNVTVFVIAEECAPGSSLIEADLIEAPFLTATTTLQVKPPAVTATGVFGYPASSGTVTGGEVETGDTTTSGDSDVLALFYLETDPVYAEQTAEISSSQLEARCGTGWAWNGESLEIHGVGVSTQPPVETPIDDDGNALFLFLGTSCAAGSSVVTADVDAGTHPTYTTTFTVLPPQPTI
jgi:hypothetical protein